MRNKHKFHIANFHIALIPRSIGLVILSFIVINFFNDSASNLLYYVVALSVALYLLTRYSTLYLDTKLAAASIINMYEKTFVPLPMNYRAWWNYKFKSGYMMFGDSFKTTATANDINVYLEITGQDGRKIIFHELIRFGTRFPNEVPYSLEKPADHAKIFKVNRTDKLLEFINERLLTKVTNSATETA